VLALFHTPLLQLAARARPATAAAAQVQQRQLRCWLLRRGHSRSPGRGWQAWQRHWPSWRQRYPKTYTCRSCCSTGKMLHHQSLLCLQLLCQRLREFGIETYD
jgi:hypothetical protein